MCNLASIGQGESHVCGTVTKIQHRFSASFFQGQIEKCTLTSGPCQEMFLDVLDVMGQPQAVQGKYSCPQQGVGLDDLEKSLLIQTVV